MVTTQLKVQWAYSGQGSHHQGKSGKIREKYFLLESQGKSGNFNIFCQGILIWPGEPNFLTYF